MKIRHIFIAATFSLVSLQALGQEFPSKTVRIIVPYAPGGGVDVLARQIAEKLTVDWRQPVIVENRPGGSTIVATGQVTKSTPDGHTLLFTTDATSTGVPHLHTNLPFDTQKDLTPVTQVANFDFMIVTHHSVPVNSLKELIDYARASSVPLNYASFGNASQSHIFFESFAAKFKLKLTQIPYKGIAPSLQAVVAGEVPLAFLGAGSSGEFVKSGKLKAFAIARTVRNPILPNVPTFEEVGIQDLNPKPWFGIHAPGGTPLAIREQIWRDVSKILKDPDNKAKMIDARGYELKLLSPNEFAEEITTDFKLHGEQIRLGKIKAE